MVVYRVISLRKKRRHLCLGVYPCEGVNLIAPFVLPIAQVPLVFRLDARDPLFHKKARFWRMDGPEQRRIRLCVGDNDAVRGALSILRIIVADAAEIAVVEGEHTGFGGGGGRVGSSGGVGGGGDGVGGNVSGVELFCFRVTAPFCRLGATGLKLQWCSARGYPWEKFYAESGLLKCCTTKATASMPVYTRFPPQEAIRVTTTTAQHVVCSERMLSFYYPSPPLCRSPSYEQFLEGYSSPFMRLAEHLTALRAWCEQCLPDW